MSDAGALVRVVAPHFVAGLIIGPDECCMYAAPILRWAVKKSRPELRSYFARKGWKASVVPPHQPQGTF